jgi:hypothetical protein
MATLVARLPAQRFDRHSLKTRKLTLLQNSSSGGSLWRVAQQQAAEVRRLLRAASSPKVFGEHKKLRAKMETPAMVLAGVSK